MDSVSVLLVGRSPAFRTQMRSLLANSGLEVHSDVSSLEEALPIIANFALDIVILNPRAGDGGLRQQLSAIYGARANVRVVMLTEEFEIDRLDEALSAGLDGYILNKLTPCALQHSLQLVHLGEKVFPSDLILLLAGQMSALQTELPVAARQRGLSARELQVLGHLLNGESNKGIANHLNLTEGTVKTHVKTVLCKINVKNRTQAAVWALNNGINADRFVCGEGHK